MEITNYDTYVVRTDEETTMDKTLLLVRLETDEGITGIGEGTSWTKNHAVADTIDVMSQYFLGRDPFEHEGLFEEMYRNEWYSNNVVNMSAIAAIDTALWDIKGKILDRPVYDLLGGPINDNRSVRAYTNAWYPGFDADPEEWIEPAKAALEPGYDAMKFDPFGDAYQRMTRKEINLTMKRIGAVREAVGPDVDLMIEGHGRFTAGTARQLAREMEEFDPTWFEEPTMEDNNEAMAKVAEQSSIPIATGERMYSKYDIEELLAETDVDIVQPDLANAGGITEIKKIGVVAEVHHTSLAIHNEMGPVGTMAAAHVDLSTPSFMIQELVMHPDGGGGDWWDDMVTDPIKIEDGRIHLSEKPGLGMDLDMDVIEEKELDDDELPPAYAVIDLDNGRPGRLPRSGGA